MVSDYPKVLRKYRKIQNYNQNESHLPDPRNNHRDAQLQLRHFIEIKNNTKIDLNKPTKKRKITFTEKDLLKKLYGKKKDTLTMIP